MRYDGSFARRRTPPGGGGAICFLSARLVTRAAQREVYLPTRRRRYSMRRSPTAVVSTPSSEAPRERARPDRPRRTPTNHSLARPERRRTGLFETEKEARAYGIAPIRMRHVEQNAAEHPRSLRAPFDSPPARRGDEIDPPRERRDENVRVLLFPSLPSSRPSSPPRRERVLRAPRVPPLVLALANLRILTQVRDEDVRRSVREHRASVPVESPTLAHRRERRGERRRRERLCRRERHHAAGAPVEKVEQ